MEFYIENQLENIVYSVILGLIFGVIYDIIRIVYVICGVASYKSGRCKIKKSRASFAVFAICDTLSAVGLTAVYSFFDYWRENMRFRAYILFSVAVGFVVYRATVGKAVMYVSEKLADVIKRLYKLIVVRPLMLLRKLFVALLSVTVVKAARLIAEQLKRIQGERKNQKALRSLTKDITMESGK